MVGIPSSDTPISTSATLPVERFVSFSRQEIVHGITTRTPDLPFYGNMSYMIGNDPELVRKSRESWAESIGFDHSQLVLGRQVHGTQIEHVDQRHAGSGADSVETSILKVDGLMTATPGLPIGVMAADCVPMLIHDPGAGAVAAIHAGWRGTVDGIALEAVDSMSATFGSRPENLIVGLGPSICLDCYEVGDEVIERWREQPWSKQSNAVAAVGERCHFDLRTANIELLKQTGVNESNIEVSPVCTRCSNGATFSRRGLGPRTGLFTAIIMLNPGTSELVEVAR